MCHTYEWCVCTRINESCHTYKRDMSHTRVMHLMYVSLVRGDIYVSVVRGDVYVTRVIHLMYMSPRTTETYISCICLHEPRRHTSHVYVSTNHGDIHLMYMSPRTTETRGSSPRTTGLNLLHRAKFQRFLSGKSVFPELKIRNPRISCTLNGVRRSSW